MDAPQGSKTASFLLISTIHIFTMFHPFLTGTCFPQVTVYDKTITLKTWLSLEFEKFRNLPNMPILSVCIFKVLEKWTDFIFRAALSLYKKLSRIYKVFIYSPLFLYTPHLAVSFAVVFSSNEVQHHFFLSWLFRKVSYKTKFKNQCFSIFHYKIRLSKIISMLSNKI